MIGIVILIGLIGLISIIISITRAYYKCDVNKVEYRYIPRTFKEEQENPVPIYDLFGDIFTNSSPWFGSYNIYDKNIRELKKKD
jgi:hypothetical protein